MKTALKISIILNLSLLGGFLFLWADQRREGTATAPSVETKVEPPVQAVAVSAPSNVQQVEPNPFQWSRLESADYHTYVKNLRDIGCPEVTLRAIVTADVDNLYRKRILELEQELTDLQNSSWSVQFKSFSYQEDLKAELRKLPGEEASDIADLLGLQPALSPEVAMNTTPPPPSVDTASPLQVSAHHNGSQPAAVLLPLVFQKIDPSVLKLDNQQVQAVNDLRQSFVDEIGALKQNSQNPVQDSQNPVQDSQNPVQDSQNPVQDSQNPVQALQNPAQNLQNPAQKQSWQTAQSQNDNLMKGYLGIMAWETYQVEAWNGP